MNDENATENYENDAKRQKLEHEESEKSLNFSFGITSFCDTTIRSSDNVKLRADKCILAATIPYFRAKFVNWTNATHERQAVFVDIMSDTIKQIVGYAYTGQVNITANNAAKLLAASDYLNMETMLDEISRYFSENLSEKNMNSTLQIATQYNLTKLRANVRKFISEKFTEIMRKSGNNELNATPLEDLCHILADHNLNTASEETVWHAIAQWIDFDCQQRWPHISQLLRCVRFSLLTPEFISQTVRQHACIRCNNLLQCGYLDGSVRRTPRHLVVAIGGWTMNGLCDHVSVYDARGNTWWSAPDTCIDHESFRGNHGAQVIYDGSEGAKVLIIGGFDGVEPYNSCRRFDARQQKWSEAAPMFHARCYVATAVLKGAVYAAGGFDGRQRHRSVEKYDPRANQWSLVASMKQRRSDAAAVALRGRLYVFGGYSGREVLSSCEQFDPAKNRWRNLPAMSTRRSGVSSAALYGRLYVLGGFDGERRVATCEMYEPRRRKWTKIGEMCAARSNFDTAIVEGKLLAVGGYNGDTTIDNVDIYDAQDDQWRSVAPLPQRRSALSVCVLTELPNMRDFISSNEK